MKNTGRVYPRWLLTLLMVVMTGLPLFFLLKFLVTGLDQLASDRILRHVVTQMSEKEKRILYSFVSQQLPGLYRAIPEPSVARVMSPNIAKEYKGAEMVSNSAGMRDLRPYTEKTQTVFRIVCLGDSFVMGVGGKERDRWGNQLEEILDGLALDLEGREIEVYSVGIGSWSALNEATYLSSRISQYAPDLVLGLMVSNDISDTNGVTGAGYSTSDFTPDSRFLGSGVLHSGWPRRFSVDRSNLLGSGMGPESQSRWRRTFEAWKRLERLVDKLGGRLVLGVLTGHYGTPDVGQELFEEAAKFHYQESGMTSPLIMTSFLDQRLSHDPHPSRRGHRVLAVHFLHVLSKLEYLPVTRADLPALEKRLDLATRHPTDAARLAALQKKVADEFLPEEIIFDQLDENILVGFLGGIYPGTEDALKRLDSYPNGTLKSAFLLKRRSGSEQVAVEIEVPPLIELYPFEVEMRLQGFLVATLGLESEDEAGRYILQGRIPKMAGSDPVVEVSMTTDSYWTTITNPTMKAYRFISATQQ